MDRLLLGFALPGDGKTLFEGILPEPVAEGSAAKTLGAFAHFGSFPGTPKGPGPGRRPKITFCNGKPYLRMVAFGKAWS